MGDLKAPVVVYHLWPQHQWQNVHAGIFDALQDSGLADACAAVHVGWASEDKPRDGFAAIARRVPSGKLHISELEHTQNELPTLHMLHTLAKASDPSTPFLYLHCRSSRHPPESEKYLPTHDHTRMMTYFLVTRWREALMHLDKGSQVVGCNIERAPFLHVAGNFWWAMAGALSKLEAPPLRRNFDESGWSHDRELAERWIGSVPRAQMFCAHHSHVNFWHERYLPERYVDA